MRSRDSYDARRQAWKAVRAVLADWELRLVDVSLRFAASQHSNRGSSEVTIYFSRSGDIVDVLEFFIADDGRMVASVDEIRKWLSTALAM